MGIRTNNITNIAGGPIDFPVGTTGATPLAWLGTWNGGTYDVNQVVDYQGSAYLCIAQNTGISPDTGQPYWALLSQAGAQGTPGTNGSDGSNGIDGAQGAQGDPGPTGPAGTDATPITNITDDGFGNLTIFTMNSFYGPYALKGPQGNDGNPGTNGTDGVASVTSNDGSVTVNYTGAWDLSVTPGIPDAPSDGNIYARQNSSWTTFSTGIGEAPFDGNTYGRNNGDWIVASGGGISDAPNDGNIYARQSQSWVLTPQSGISGIDITINGTYQGNYDGIQFFDGPGSSSGNTIYLGN